MLNGLYSYLSLKWAMRLLETTLTKLIHYFKYKLLFQTQAIFCKVKSDSLKNIFIGEIIANTAFS